METRDGSTPLGERDLIGSLIFSINLKGGDVKKMKIQISIPKELYEFLEAIFKFSKSPDLETYLSEVLLDSILADIDWLGDNPFFEVSEIRAKYQTASEKKVEISADLFERLKKKAGEEGVSVEDFVENLVERYNP